MHLLSVHLRMVHEQRHAAGGDRGEQCSLGRGVGDRSVTSDMCAAR